MKARASWLASASLLVTVFASGGAFAQIKELGAGAGGVVSPDGEAASGVKKNAMTEAEAAAFAERAHFSHPDFALSVGMGWAIGSLNLHQALNEVRTANGYDEVTPYATGFVFNFDFELYRVTAELGFEVFDLQLTDGYGQVGVHGSLGYRLTSSGPWLVTPALGYGAFQGTACFEGNPTQQNDPQADSFTQVVQNPGPSTCLRSWQHFVRASFGVDYRFFPSDEMGGRPGFFLGIRADTSLPVGNPKWAFSELDDLPAFDGPTTPIAGWTVGLVGGFTIGLDFDELAAPIQPPAETLPADLD